MAGNEYAKIGEKRIGLEIGKKGRHAYIWLACADCGKERWVYIVRQNPSHQRCRVCEGKTRKGDKCWNWKGGRHLDSRGYVLVQLSAGDTFYPMVDHKRYVAEHRLVMAKHLGRCLAKKELVHHVNGIKADNHIENLELLSRTSHRLRTKFCGNCELKKQIKLLRWQVKELTVAVQSKLAIENGNILGRS